MDLGGMDPESSGPESHLVVGIFSGGKNDDGPTIWSASAGNAVKWIDCIIGAPINSNVCNLSFHNSQYVLFSAGASVFHVYVGSECLP